MPTLWSFSTVATPSSSASLHDPPPHPAYFGRFRGLYSRLDYIYLPLCNNSKLSAMMPGISLFSVGRYYYKMFRSTVISDIWPEVLFFTLVAVSEYLHVLIKRAFETNSHIVVVLVSELTSTSLAVSNQMLTVLGTVLGLVISFRTSTAYERSLYSIVQTLKHLC